MLQPTIVWDRAGFSRGLRDLQAATGKAMRDLVKQQAGLVARDAMLLTPPHRGRGSSPIKDSLRKHQRAGEAAVERDMRQVFLAVEDSKIAKDPKFGPYLKRYSRQRRLAAIQTMANRMGLRVPVLLAADRATHVAARNKRGRVKGRGPYAIVVKKSTIKQLIAQTKKHVGGEKASWAPAVRKLMPKFPIPKWISRHAPSGWADTSGLNNQRNPSVTIGALLKYGWEYADLRILESAIENRIRSMRNQAAIIFRAKLAKFRR